MRQHWKSQCYRVHMNKKDGENKITDVVSSVMKSSLAISETLSILNSRSNE